MGANCAKLVRGWKLQRSARRAELQQEIMKRIRSAPLAAACHSCRWMCDPGAAEIHRNDDRRDDRAAPGRRLPEGTEMVVLPAVEHLHFPCRAADRTPLACVRLPLLSQGTRIRSKWPETERAKDEPSGQGVRGDFYDRGQRLGRWTDFWTNHHWTYFGKFFFLSNCIFLLLLSFFFLCTFPYLIFALSFTAVKRKGREGRDEYARVYMRCGEQDIWYFFIFDDFTCFYF